MYSLAPKRCLQCVGVVTTMPLDHAEEFEAHGAVVVYKRCDSVAGADKTLHVPDDWD